MRAVIGREGKAPAGDDGCKSIGGHAEPGEALRQRGFAAEPENQRAACEGTARYRAYRSSAKILISRTGWMRANLTMGSSAASSAASMATPSNSSNCSGKT